MYGDIQHNVDSKTIELKGLRKESKSETRKLIIDQLAKAEKGSKHEYILQKALKLNKK